MIDTGAGKVVIKQGDALRVSGKSKRAWINDEVINLAVGILQTMVVEAKGAQLRTLIANTWFYPKLVEDDKERLARWWTSSKFKDRGLGHISMFKIANIICECC